MEKTPAERLAERGFTLERDVFGQLVLTDADGRKWSGVEPARAFPISNPGQWVSLCDAEGREVLCIREFDKLSPDLRRMLEEELGRREFVPEIKNILNVADDADPSEWEVETDRGATTFLLDSEDDVRRLGPHRALFIDTHGIRYLIPDTRKLNARSRRLLERYF
ncbi:MAG: DUF1854 domain-containing protein [Pirellulales bacterium]|nr:DUF1854 domain-containing protein [Pirellulales bacterium]